MQTKLFNYFLLFEIISVLVIFPFSLKISLVSGSCIKAIRLDLLQRIS